MPRDDRPTLMPPFDPAAFARESESKLRVAPQVEVVENESSVVRRAEPLPAHEPFSGDPFEGLSFDDEPMRETRPVPIVLMAVPTLAVSRAELGRLKLDHRAGFVLSHVDGVSDVESILDVSAMPQEETLNILAELAAQGIIIIR